MRVAREVNGELQHVVLRPVRWSILFAVRPFLLVFLLDSSPCRFMSHFFSTLALTSPSFLRVLILFYRISMCFFENMLGMFW